MNPERTELDVADVGHSFRSARIELRNRRLLVRIQRGVFAEKAARVRTCTRYISCSILAQSGERASVTVTDARENGPKQPRGRTVSAISWPS